MAAADRSNFVVNLLGQWQESDFGNSNAIPVGGLAYYLSPPQCAPRKHRWWTRRFAQSRGTTPTVDNITLTSHSINNIIFLHIHEDVYSEHSV